MGHFLSWSFWNQASISIGFQDIQWQMRRIIDMTLNHPYAKVKVIRFGTSRFLTYDFYKLSIVTCALV